MLDHVPQTAALCFRAPRGQVEVLLITNSAGQWAIPKGHVDPGFTPPEMALIEAWEEGGVRGSIEGPRLAAYRYEKPDGRRCVVQAFAMRVLEVHDDWPERDRRRRAWCAIDDAFARLELHGPRRALTALAARLRAGTLG